MKQDLVIKLREQHAILEHLLAEINSQANPNHPNCDAIVTSLDEFKKILFEHLELEDKEFYPQLLIMMKEKGQNEISMIETKDFMAKINDISEQTVDFLGAYDSSEKIMKNIDDFKSLLNKITKILTLRLDMENNLVYKSWEYLQK